MLLNKWWWKFNWCIKCTPGCMPSGFRTGPWFTEGQGRSSAGSQRLTPTWPPRTTTSYHHQPTEKTTESQTNTPFSLPVLASETAPVSSPFLLVYVFSLVRLSGKQTWLTQNQAELCRGLSFTEAISSAQRGLQSKHLCFSWVTVFVRSKLAQHHADLPSCDC